MKIIFLDYDGVVNTLWFDNPLDLHPEFNFPNDNKVNNTQAIGWLNYLYNKFPYKIVVCSTWRTFKNYETYLYNAGLNPKIEILGKTPDLPYPRKRGDEIQKWLDIHSNLDIEDFVIIDDSEDMVHLQPHLIKTDTYLGFTIYEYEKIEKRWKK